MRKVELVLEQCRSTGNQTPRTREARRRWFWSSVDLTGNQTLDEVGFAPTEFWSSVDLTGNQTIPLSKSG